MKQYLARKERVKPLVERKRTHIGSCLHVFGGGHLLDLQNCAIRMWRALEEA